MNKRIQFGKAIEYKVVSEMLREGFEVYLPSVDDHGVDLLARTLKGNLVEVQVKALSKSAKGGALFAGINHTPRSGFYFVFYVEKQDATWIFSSYDFVKMASQNKMGKNVGKYSLNVLSTACSKYKVNNYSSIV